MTVKQFLSFLYGLVLTGLVYGVITYIIVFSTFSFAGERLTRKEGREAFFFYLTAIVTIATIYTIVRRLKTSRKFSAIGISIPLLVAIYACLNPGQTYFSNLNYHQKFDKIIWAKAISKPFKMAKTLANDKTLVGQTKLQVIEKLGVSHESFKNANVDYFKYLTNKETRELRIYFKNNKVREAYLYEEGLGI